MTPEDDKSVFDDMDADFADHVRLPGARAANHGTPLRLLAAAAGNRVNKGLQ